MSRILTVTLNPALDLATSTPAVVPNQKLRCGPETAEPGGGGVNVARAVSQLGGTATAVVALGGATGVALGDLLRALPFDLIEVPAPGDTRHSFAVTDTAQNAQYRFVLNGPHWSDVQIATFLGQMVQTVRSGDLLILSGSMPPGVSPGFVTLVCDTLPNCNVVVDTSGPHLHALAQAPNPAPAVLRMDSHEARDLSGSMLETQRESASFAESLRRKGVAKTIIIARGKDGSVMADESGLWHVTAANTHVVSAIGAGDSFVGGFVLGLQQKHSTTEALCMGSAAAAAACLSEGTQLCNYEDWMHMRSQTKLTRL